MSGRSRPRSKRTMVRGRSVRPSVRSCKRSCNRVTIPSGSRWATSWPAVRLDCLWEGRTGTGRRTTSTSNAGSDSPKDTSAACMATATPGAVSCRRGPHYCWPLMPTWSIPRPLPWQTSGPTGMRRPQQVSVRLCIAARSCATRAPRNVAPSFSQTWNAVIVREISFLPDRCLFYYQLALLAIIWLFVLLHLPESKPGLPAPPVPATPKRKRSPEPKAFEGLTHKPPCVLCEPETGETHPPPPVRPDPMPPTHRRPRTVDTSVHFCPHTDCDYRGWRGLGNLRANGHPSGGPWRQFHCLGCNGFFPEHHGTIFHGKQAAVELMVRVLACVAEGLGIRGTARVFEVDPNTVLHWLVEAAEQLRAFSCYFLCDLHVRQIQLDELYAVLSAVKGGALSEDEAIRRLSHSPQWGWTAMDPETKLLLVIEVGTP